MHGAERLNVSAFQAVLSPPEWLVRELSERYPCVPFLTPQYLQACIAVGETPCALFERDGAEVAGTVGSLRTGRLSSLLQIPCAPCVPDPGHYWRNLQSFCRQQRIWCLRVHSYASERADIPRLYGERLRCPRNEHVIALDHPRALSLSPHHQRSVKKAQRAGLTITATRSTGDLQVHWALVAASLQRRAAHLADATSAEAIQLQRARCEMDSARPFELALLASGAAEMFQARRGSEVMSSLFVLRAPQGMYYRTGGTCESGMTLGASAFLIATLAGQLRDQGKREFNLGGSGPPSTGLWRFKAGFGGGQRALEAVEVSTEPALIGALRWGRDIARRLRQDPQTEKPAPAPAMP